MIKNDKKFKVVLIDKTNNGKVISSDLCYDTAVKLAMTNNDINESKGQYLVEEDDSER